jgi:hypothetical protein
MKQPILLLALLAAAFLGAAPAGAMEYGHVTNASTTDQHGRI